MTKTKAAPKTAKKPNRKTADKAQFQRFVETAELLGRQELAAIAGVELDLTLLDQMSPALEREQVIACHADEMVLVRRQVRRRRAHGPLPPGGRDRWSG